MKISRSTVCVCKYIYHVQVADITAYATSSKALVTLLTEGNLIAWGKTQRIGGSYVNYKC